MMHKHFRKCHRYRLEKEAFLVKISCAIYTGGKCFKVMSAPEIFLQALTHLENGVSVRVGLRVGRKPEEWETNQLSSHGVTGIRSLDQLRRQFLFWIGQGRSVAGENNLHLKNFGGEGKEWSLPQALPFAATPLSWWSWVLRHQQFTIISSWLPI